ncbi:hypothetical protein I4U23_021155 [Adineta vaga]|nr:hypothetical protein I4U23_021155 [Adineta vaga]
MDLFPWLLKLYEMMGLQLFIILSASSLRQATYTTVRFGIYGAVRSSKKDSTLNFFEKVSLAAVSGAIGAFVGAPADLVNVRMQNDCKLPKEKRRNYKHAIDGIARISREEGTKKLFNGASMAVVRGALVTVGQIAFYEQVKQMLLASGYFKDNIVTHFSSSFVAGGVATLLTMPFDVMKTRMMNAPPGTYNSLLDCFRDIFSVGPSGFFKGFVPAFIRLGPHTILTFIFLEQLKKHFGYIKTDKQCQKCL